MTTWFTADDCRLEGFRALVEQRTAAADHPHAADVVQNVPIYRDVRHTPEFQAEVARALLDGPDVVVFEAAFDAAVVDRATGVFAGLIAEEKAAGVGGGGDHFAKPGANDRVWGALDKFAVRDPEAFAAYYANDVLALIANAWLGAGYQVTSQINVVNPGGQAQVAHRDYHLGFMSQEQAARYPAHVHRLSPRSPCRARSRTSTCRWRRGRRSTCRIRNGIRPVTSPSTGRSSRPTSPRTTSSCRCARATRCSSTRRCFTARAPTGRPAYGGWRTCCRCRPRSAGRWKPSTGPRCASHCTRS